MLKTEMDLSIYTNYLSLALGINDYISYYNYDRGQVNIHWMTPYEYDQYLDKSTPKKYLPINYLPNVIYA